MGVSGIKESLRGARDTNAANVLNFGFNPQFTLADGQPLFSTQHPIDGGVVANTFANVYTQLSQAALEDADILINIFRGANDTLLPVKAQKLIVGPYLKYAAERLLRSEFRTDTSNNDVSALYTAGSYPQGYTVNHYLTSPSFWAVKTNNPGLIFLRRQNVQVDMFPDQYTQNIITLGTERYSVGCYDFRSIFGSQGA